MSYAAELAKLSRRKIDYVLLKMDYCSNTYGVAPCAAFEAIKCYNTFSTCKDKPNFTKSTKDYGFINANLPIGVIDFFYGARPYIKKISDLPTEIKEKDTISRRLKVEFYDEEDNDFGIDPYREERSSIQGSFWKKFLARNKNYKGRILELYEGFEGLALNDFQMKFAGPVENIELKNGYVIIECVDLLKELSKEKYPIVTRVALDGDLHTIFTAASEEEMTALSGAMIGDYAKRTDFEAITNITATPYEDLNGEYSDAGVWYIHYTIVAFDSQGRPFAKGNVLLNAQDFGPSNAVLLVWDDDARAVIWRIYKGAHVELLGPDLDYDWVYTEIPDYPNEFQDKGFLSTDIAGSAPAAAERYYRYTNDPYTAAVNWWDEIPAVLTIDVNDAADLPESGYVQIEKEKISYASKSGNTLSSVVRGFADSEILRHASGTILELFIAAEASNPFSLAKNLLLRRISSSYIDSKFDDYISGWTGINFSAKLILKADNLAKVYFDLIAVLDCMTWVGEDGKIKILKHNEVPSSIPLLTEEANIISGSLTIDNNEESRKTRWILFWNSFDVEKGISDRERYSRVTIAVDAIAESADEYNDSIEDLQYTAWLNSDSDVDADVGQYINNLLAARLSRTRDAQRILEYDVELKDSGLLVGGIVDVKTSQVQNIYGETTIDRYRIIKKTPRAVNKFGLKVIKVNTQLHDLSGIVMWDSFAN